MDKAPIAPPPAATGGALKAVLFALVVLCPVVALGYVFLDVSRTGGIKQLPDGTTVVDLQSMSSFSFDQLDGTINDVPEKYRELDGKRVALEGEMYVANSSAGEVEKFDLVYSIADCCYSGKPQVQHFVRSQTKPGQPVTKHKGEVLAYGTLRVEVTREGDEITGVYHLAVDDVEPLD